MNWVEVGLVVALSFALLMVILGTVLVGLIVYFGNKENDE